MTQKDLNTLYKSFFVNRNDDDFYHNKACAAFYKAVKKAGGKAINFDETDGGAGCLELVQEFKKYAIVLNDPEFKDTGDYGWIIFPK